MIPTLPLTLVALCLAGPAGAADEFSEPGRWPVAVVAGVWGDAGRESRAVRWKCYLPRGVAGRSPVVVYSHGLGGNRDGNEMLGRHLAGHGVASLHVQHEGSDDRAVRGSLRALKAVNDPKLSEPRFRDIRFVVNTIKADRSLGELAGRLDGNRIGVSGHSYGGLTCQVVAGQTVAGYGQSLAVPEVRGVFVLSPSPPRGEYGNAATSFQKMRVPMFSVTGTRDVPPDRAFPAKDRRVPFDRTASVDQWLLVLNGASHFTTSGLKERPAVARLIPGMDADPDLDAHHALIRAAALAFWRSVLLDDKAARAYLSGGDFAKAVGDRGVLEVKPAKRP